MVDANVLFAGLVWPRWSYEVLRHAANGDFHMILVPQVIAEARKNDEKISLDELGSQLKEKGLL